ncbi:hypothetical protein ABH922_001371 [Rhodococcus sp. 27YEA15]|uniref:hypothetical protein n=1 Tax=Rhodococcus sp. 27YEA15 TaxID=3156259 RepID=UPI003C7A9570
MRITRAKRLERVGAMAAAATLAATVIISATAGSSGAQPVHTEDPYAARAVAAATTDDGVVAAAAIPEDFATFAGYEPTIVDGYLANPNGDCSSPVPLPAEFDSACKAHDLGYDLLRYAYEHGAELRPWARQALDAQLDARMHSACEDRSDGPSRTFCFSMAEIATAAVSGNSWRQGYLTPVQESGAGYAVAGVLGVSVLGLGCWRRRRAAGISDDAKAVAA